MELTEKQLSKLRDLHRMTHHWYHWVYDVLDQPEITPEQHRVLLKLADMSLTEQMETYLVDGELTELPLNPEYYRKIQKPKRQGGFKWEKRPDPYRKPKKDK